jgi:hypothetical protein
LKNARQGRNCCHKGCPKKTCKLEITTLSLAFIWSVEKSCHKIIAKECKNCSTTKFAHTNFNILDGKFKDNNVTGLGDDTSTATENRKIQLID